MAAFNALGLGLLLGGAANTGAGGAIGAVGRKRKSPNITAPGPQGTGPIATPTSPDAPATAPDVMTAMQGMVRRRKRPAAGSSGTVAGSTMQPQVEPRTLLGY